MGESQNKDHLIGVDLGGTKILAGVFDGKMELRGTAKFSTKAGRGVESVIDRIGRCVLDALDECDLDLKQVRGVGIGAPGVVDSDAGRVIFAPNLPEWKDVPLKKELEKRLQIPVFVGNDCNVCTLGVFDQELKSKPRQMVGVFLGTGVGGGLILNGELYHGHSLTAGEIGHMVIEVNGPKCACGNRGCLEALASRTAIFRRILAAVKDGQKTILTDMLGSDLADMRSGDLRKAIRRGDKFVQQVIEEAAEFAGIGVANLVNILNPELVVLGGGVIEALQDEMMPTILKTVKEHAMPGSLKGVDVIASKLGDNAGITGGAVLAKRQTK